MPFQFKPGMQCLVLKGAVMWPKHDSSEGDCTFAHQNEPGFVIAVDDGHDAWGMKTMFVVARCGWGWISYDYDGPETHQDFPEVILVEPLCNERLVVRRAAAL